MSDDYSDSSNGPSYSDEPAPQIANAALRIAVTARSADTANRIWQEIRRRIAKRGEFIALLTQGTDAGVAVFHLTTEDLASDDAAKTLLEKMLAAAAPLNFLVCSSLKGDDQESRRLETMLSASSKRSRFLRAPVPRETGDAKPGQDDLLLQVRGIANHLLDNPPPLSSVSLSEFSANEKEMRRESKGAKKSAKRGKDVPAAASTNKAERKGAARKKSAASSVAALRGEVEADENPSKPVARANKAEKGEKKEKSAKKQERAADREKRKVEKQHATDAQPADREKKKDKAARKAAQAAEREKRKAEKRAASEGDAEKRERKDKSGGKAERKARKAAAAQASSVEPIDAPREKRKKEKSEPLSETEKLARKTARKEERKKQKHGGADGQGDEDFSRTLRISLKGFDEPAAQSLRRALEQRLDGTPVEWPQPGKKADITVYGFDDPPLSAVEVSNNAASIAQDTTRLRIFVARDDADASTRRASAALAGAFESPLLRLTEKLERYGTDDSTRSDILATSILGIAAGGRLSKHRVPRPAPLSAPDLVEARALAATPREFLEQLTWTDAIAPRLLWTHASKDSAEALMNRKLVLSEEQTLDITVPISWPDDASGRTSAADIFGLEFLSGPLNYWYSKANGRESTKVAEVDAVLKKHGATASQILAQSGAIIMDFVGKHPLSASTAWEENAVSRRARVFALYLLCCKMAVKRKIKFDEAVCTEVILRLLEAVEVLRSDDFYTPCSFDGVQQDCLLVGLALVLRNTAYSQVLMRESLDRLLSCQLEPGLTADGVWRTGTFSDHCSLLSQLRILLSDFDKNDLAILEPVAAAAKKMTVFAEAMQKSNGSAPSFDDSSDKSFARKLTGTRRALAGAGFAKNAPQRKVTPPRMTDTYVFRDAQYFVSHSTLKVVPESSLVILHADAASFATSDPGGVTLAFAYGASDLLVRAEPPEGESRRETEFRFDPALRNGYHIDGAGRGGDAPINPNAARLEKSWRGPGWAAARSVDETNPTGSITRTVIHLKAEHALVIVDELSAKSGQEAAFEQFWQIASGLSPAPSDGPQYRFDIAGKGGLTAAFDAPAKTTIEPRGEGSCIRRELRMAKGLAVSVFRWTAEPGPVTVKSGKQADGWSVDVSGAGFAGQIVLAAGELRYTPRAV